MLRQFVSPDRASLAGGRLFAGFAAKARQGRAVMSVIVSLYGMACRVRFSVFFGAAWGFRACGRGQRALPFGNPPPL